MPPWAQAYSLMLLGLLAAAALIFVPLILAALRFAIRLRLRLALIVLTLMLLFFTGVFNWTACQGFQIVLGGSALRGKVVRGHFFLVERARSTEVSERVFKNMLRYETFSDRLTSIGCLSLVGCFGFYTWAKKRNPRES
jgi:hypothetical protein